MNKLVSIIIVTFNSVKTVGKCLNSLKTNNNSEIIVVDNFSQDKTVQLLKKNFGEKIKLIKNKKNLGFAKACNQAVKLARGKYLLFLNPDTKIITEDFFKKAYEIGESKKNLGALGFKTLNPDKSLQNSCGSIPTILNVVADRFPVVNKVFRTELIRSNSFYMKEQNPDWVSGCCLFIKRSIFGKLGGFDESYFMYVEDVDYCYRVKKLGLKVYYVPEIEIVHLDEGRTAGRKDFKAMQMRKGFSIFFKKYKSRLYYLAWKTIMLLESFFRPKFRGI